MMNLRRKASLAIFTLMRILFGVSVNMPCKIVTLSILSRKDSSEQSYENPSTHVASRNICYFTHKLNGEESKDSPNYFARI